MQLGASLLLSLGLEAFLTAKYALNQTPNE
jgi:hypothetical protein